MIGCELPGIFAEEFCYGSEHATFDDHLSMQLVVAVEFRQALNGEPIQDDPSIDYPPALDTVGN